MNGRRICVSPSTFENSSTPAFSPGMQTPVTVLRVHTPMAKRLQCIHRYFMRSQCFPCFESGDGVHAIGITLGPGTAQEKDRSFPSSSDDIEGRFSRASLLKLPLLAASVAQSSVRHPLRIRWRARVRQPLSSVSWPRRIPC